MTSTPVELATIEGYWRVVDATLTINDMTPEVEVGDWTLLLHDGVFVHTYDPPIGEVWRDEGTYVLHEERNEVEVHVKLQKRQLRCRGPGAPWEPELTRRGGQQCRLTALRAAR